jgi:uridine kinase
MEQILGREGLKFVTLNVDNYFFDLEVHPKDEFGDYDFETPQALDLPLINEHLRRLVAGEQVKIPYYDFKTSRRFLDRTSVKLREDEILLIDSLHGLYPAMSDGLPHESIFKLYLEPLLQLKSSEGYVRWTDLRLIRRMLRDASHRAYKPRQTLEHWHYVRASELRNIIPYITTTDFIINSGMPYELCLYRPRLLESFRQWEDDYEEDPLRVDAYMRARRVKKLLEEVEPYSDDSSIPMDSVLREFIGGSTFRY